MGAVPDVNHPGAQPGIGLLPRPRLRQSLLNEQGCNPDLIELQLAHVPKDRIRAAYSRSVKVDVRRKMLQHWACYLDRLREGPVIPSGAVSNGPIEVTARFSLGFSGHRTCEVVLAQSEDRAVLSRGETDDRSGAGPKHARVRAGARGTLVRGSRCWRKIGLGRQGHDACDGPWRWPAAIG